MKNTLGLSVDKRSVWFKDWFNSSFYHKLYANRDEKEAVAFIDELLEELQPLEDAFMLDLGCGAGRHAKYLASKGYKVSGIDLASSSIREAKRSETSRLRFYRHDMRLPFGNNQFDHVFNFFTSFGYFTDEDENLRVINNIYNALKPGGILVMDYINVTRAEKNLVPEEEKEIDGVVYKLSRWTDNRYFYKKIVIEAMQPGGAIEYTEQVAKFDLKDFELLFRSAGLQLKKVYGDYNLGEYDPETSPRLIMLVKK